MNKTQLLNHATEQLTGISDLILTYYPNEIQEGETVVDVVKRLLKPTTAGVADAAGPVKVPNWAVDTLAKKELKRLAQHMINNYPNMLKSGTIVDSVISSLDVAYKDLVPSH